MPFAASAVATFLSRPAQPPSPDNSTAKVSPEPSALTSISGRSERLAGGGGSAVASAAPANLSYAERNCGSQSFSAVYQCDTPGSSTNCAPETRATNVRAAAVLQTLSREPCKATQLADNFFAGS